MSSISLAFTFEGSYDDTHGMLGDIFKAMDSMKNVRVLDEVTRLEQAQRIFVLDVEIAVSYIFFRQYSSQIDRLFGGYRNRYRFEVSGSSEYTSKITDVFTDALLNTKSVADESIRLEQIA